MDDVGYDYGDYCIYGIERGIEAISWSAMIYRNSAVDDYGDVGDGIGDFGSYHDLENDSDCDHRPSGNEEDVINSFSDGNGPNVGNISTIKHIIMATVYFGQPN